MRKTLTLLFAFLLSAGAVRALELRAELELDSTWLAPGDDLVASVTIANETTRTVLVPRWLLPGARLDADLFAVTRGGEPAAYLGRLVKRAAPGAAELVPLAPGETLRGETELTKHYDMAAGGEYAVSYRADLLDGFVARGAGEADAFREVVVSNAVAVWRDGPTAESRPVWEAAASAVASLTTPNCSSSESSTIAAAVNGATSYSVGAEAYLDSRSWSSVGARYTTWFGAPDSGRFDTVSDNFTAIRQAFQTAPIVVNCDCDEPYYAYVYSNQPYEIYVCNAFWSAPTTGTDSKAGTLVHEMSHFDVVAGTLDRAYGQSACMNLANSQPQLAVANADSHEYFAENTPPLEGGGGGGGSAGSLRFADGSSSVDESAGTVTLTVRRTGGSTGAVSVAFATVNGTAGAPSDYASAGGILSWGNGDSSDKSFVVTLVDDAETEADETFTALLSSPTGGASVGSPSSTTVTILDRDCTPSACVPDATTLCLAGGSGTPNRFRVRVTWTDFEGASGSGTALPYTADSGLFYFFNSQNLELLVKMVNGCSANGAFWFYYGSTSNVGLVYTVDDLQACDSRTFSVPIGEFASNGDIQFFNQSCL